MNKKVLIFLAVGGLILVSIYFIFLSKPKEDNFKAPGRNWPSQKKVEDYFVEKLRMTPDDLKIHKDRKEITYRLTENSTLNGIIENLHYYGFIRDKKAFLYALEHTKDTITGKEKAIKVGKNGTIDINASYRISEDMNAWEIADILLNKPSYFKFDEYGYMFMP